MRVAPVARAAYGALLLAAPKRLLAVGDLDRTPGWAPAVVRLLGARHLLQAGVLGLRPGLGPLGALVDLAHASTDVGCAALLPAMRRSALLDAGVALLLAAVSGSGS
jgi:hypothetical protein